MDMRATRRQAREKLSARFSWPSPSQKSQPICAAAAPGILSCAAAQQKAAVSMDDGTAQVEHRPRLPLLQPIVLASHEPTRCKSPAVRVATKHASCQCKCVPKTFTS